MFDIVGTQKPFICLHGHRKSHYYTLPGQKETLFDIFIEKTLHLSLWRKQTVGIVGTENTLFENVID